MKILYIGDIMGEAGRKVVSEILPGLKKEHEIDVVAAQSENVSHGKSMLPRHMRELQEHGVDFFTGGNHSIERPQLYPLLENPGEPVLRPANMKDVPGVRFKSVEVGKKSVLFVSLLGEIFPEPLDTINPLDCIDDILKSEAHKHDEIIVNFHGDFSSQKRVIGYYLDGRVSAVIGDHWHVPTNDAMVLPKGTAHITDVGMCGSLHSSLGIELEWAFKNWRGVASKKNMALKPPLQFNGVIINTDNKIANTIVQYHKIVT